MTSPAPLIELRVLEPLQTNIPPVHKGIADLARQIVARLSELPVGGGVEYRLPLELSGHALRQAIAGATLGMAIGITTRLRGESFRLWRCEPPQRKRSANERAQLVLERRFNGETLDAIASDLRITRERVRQIEKKYGKFTHLSCTSRASAVDEFMAPYLEATPGRITCVLCAEPLKAGANMVCKSCRATLKVIRMAASNLRTYRTSGNRQSLRIATSLVRVHNLTPEDMRRG